MAQQYNRHRFDLADERRRSPVLRGRLAAAQDWVVQGVGDFDGDGKADILWRNKTTGVVSIWLMNGGTILAHVGGQTVAKDWVVQAVADFNGDRKADILWRNNAAGSVSIWLMNSGTVLSYTGGQVVDKGWVVQGVGDFNGDGKADILWRNAAGTTAMWFMNGGTVLSYGPQQSAALDWTVQDVGDYTGDRKADILWRNKSTGAVSIWQMNGGAVQAYVGGQGVAATWGVQTASPPRVSLVWQYSASGQAGFKIERSLNGSTNWTEIGTTAANVTSHQDSGLAHSSTYYYRVRAYNANGASSYSNVMSVTTP